MKERCPYCHTYSVKTIGRVFKNYGKKVKRCSSCGFIYHAGKSIWPKNRPLTAKEEGFLDNPTTKE